MRSQPRIKGVRRLPTFSAFHPFVRQIIKRQSRRTNRSVSWVIAEIISDAVGVDIMTGELRKKEKR